MRYAIVTETYPPEVNGVALTVQGLERGLRGLGREVRLVRPRRADESGPGTSTEHRVAGLPLPRYPGLRFGLPAGGLLRRQWRQWRPDAVYVATEGPLGVSALGAAKALGIPVATGLHTRFDRYMHDYAGARLGAWLSPLALRWMRRFHNRGDATLVPTRELCAFLETQGFAHPVRLARAVDTRLFDPDRRDPALRAQWRAASGAPVLVHVGRIAPEKNPDLVVRAFEALRAVRPDARLVWVGDGPERERLKLRHPDFVFCGVQRGEALARHFASADLFVFPSRSETFGNVTLEAMASGVATVAFDSGAAREHLRHGTHGAAVADGDEAGFIDATVSLGRDPARTRAMGAAARAAVLMLRPEQVARDLDAILHGLARRTHATASLA